ncbi:hypothetical protein GGI15_002976 [Coemansia interrupta]|uniref:DUF4246 domain-containing protein n=1 Tax=Coemansia interrupta TaxID=1126814 RepID=A0A9W8HF69_9FUNG|nr:hypothetical protein GGI15_002976 [Coemansia interrupta]
MSTISASPMLDQLLRQKFWPKAIYDISPAKVETRSQKRVRQMCDAIRAKPNWTEKLKDAEIRARWSAEATSGGFLKQELAYALDKLDYFASLHAPGSSIGMSPVEQVWVSDSLIDPDTETKLKEYVAILEDVPDSKKDWHPNSNNQVLNLIHPSLFPLIYGRSHVLITPIPTPKDALTLKSFGQAPENHDAWRKFLMEHFKSSEDSTVSKYFMPDKPVLGRHQFVLKPESKFCWLPTEFDVAEDGKTTIISYINNLHPVKHAELYPTIASIFSKFVPLLEQVLTDIAHPRPEYIIDPADREAHDKLEPDYKGEGDEYYDYEKEREQWEEMYAMTEQKPLPFVAPDRPTVPYSLRGRCLQAIVKMSNIILTPEKPEYEGGTWHVEALENERIIATGIYYYDIDNITESNLAFRESIDWLSVDYEQFRFDQLKKDYTIYEGNEDRPSDELVLISQQLGQVEAKNGRCIVFPNIYQHRVSGFRLADPTKPGHRKIFAFFFVDPSTRIPSTEIVPPQQQEWWNETFMKTGRLAGMPDLVKNGIFENVDFPISLKDAHSVRLELMAERKANEMGEDSTFEPFFSFCEH